MLNQFSRRLKKLIKPLMFFVFRMLQRVGLSVLPNHYYSPVPDIGALRQTKDDWAKPSAMAGIDVDIEQQIRALEEIVAPYKSEYEENRIYNDAIGAHFGPGFGPIEAQALHGFIRHIRPPRVIEVGSGVSTYCMLKAAELNDTPTKFICVEPYPSPFIKGADVELKDDRVESMDPSFFDQLTAGDLLFIDSSHAVRPGGDVQYLYLEVLPRLNPGVHVHIHDVYLPYLYNRDVLDSFFHWGETALLAALMVNNNKLSTTFCMSMLHYEAQDALMRVFPGYKPQSDANGLWKGDADEADRHFPASIYLLTQDPSER